ncbi:ribonuclease domain-containing protein [Streptomyces violascens]|uniref:ribonuclease domain-containing protein n=1 Tax=Streptomyces violascens TaxID=67381 RepID=UPI0037B150CF
MINRFARIALAAVLSCLAVLLVGCGGKDSAKPAGGKPSTAASTPAWVKGMATVPADRLPPEARQTLKLIDSGGPFPYSKDGVVFGNFEKLLPQQKRGYYHEYTVQNPKSRDRGAWRIVTGQGKEFYWTDDHYKSFKAVLR